MLEGAAEHVLLRASVGVTEELFTCCATKTLDRLSQTAGVYISAPV
jgi:hypothetical protein